MLAGRTQPARNSGQLLSAPDAYARKRIRIRVTEHGRHNRSKTCKRQNIHRIVMKNRHQPLRFPAAQVFEIHIWDKLARQVALAINAQDLLFQLHQAAAFQAQFPETARAMQQIEMTQARKRRLVTGHAIASLEQRLVIGASVIRDQDVETLQMRRKRREQTALFGVLAHEELANAEAFRGNAANAN